MSLYTSWERATCSHTLMRCGGKGPSKKKTETHGEGGEKKKKKKYVEMTKADAMQEASGEDETLKTARLPSDEREQPSFPLKSSDYTNANQTDKHKRPDK